MKNIRGKDATQEIPTSLPDTSQSSPKSGCEVRKRAYRTSRSPMYCTASGRARGGLVSLTPDNRRRPAPLTPPRPPDPDVVVVALLIRPPAVPWLQISRVPPGVSHHTLLWMPEHSRDTRDRSPCTPVPRRVWKPCRTGLLYLPTTS
jgi:hypothetical protein